MSFTIPGEDKRTTIVGRTGSGKTQFGAFILSKQPFQQMPWVVLDFKREGIFSELVGTRHLSMDGKGWDAINQPGLFVARPNLDEEEQVNELLWHIWNHEYCGVFVDEGYMIGKSKAFIACLTQGRSKIIPMIICTQRPTWITKFAFSEANFIQVFQLTLKDDRKTVSEYISEDSQALIEKRLPAFHSYWYDVDQDQVTPLRPAPGRDQIIGDFNAKLAALNRANQQKQFV